MRIFNSSNFESQVDGMTIFNFALFYFLIQFSMILCFFRINAVFSTKYQFS